MSRSDHLTFRDVLVGLLVVVAFFVPFLVIPLLARWAVGW